MIMEASYARGKMLGDVFRDVSVTRNMQQGLCALNAQPLSKSRGGLRNQARLRRIISVASPSRLSVAVAGSGTAPATTY